MANPHNTNNYAIGKGVLSIAEFADGAPGTYQDLGNCSSFEIEPTVEKLPHYSHRSGFRTKDKNPIIQTEYTVTFDLDEIAASNLALFMMGGVVTGWKVNALTEPDKEFALRFVSDNPTGPDQQWDLWRMTIGPNGAVQLIGDEWMVMSFAGEGLSDTTNHPESPFITVDYEATYAETSGSESSYSSEDTS